MKKEVRLEYISSWFHQGEIRTPVFQEMMVDTLYVKQYTSAVYALAGLNAASRDLMDYMVMKMDHDNEITSNRKLREDFAAFISKVTGGEVQYKDNTIRTSLGVLKKKGLILTKYRGVFIVNPKFFFKKSERERIDAIRLVMEFNADKEVEAFNDSRSFNQ
jgi:hypothetical protein